MSTLDTRHSARLTASRIMSFKRHEHTESSSYVRVPSPRGTKTCPVIGSQRSRRELFDLFSVFQAATRLSKVAAAIVVILFVCNGEEASGASTDTRVTVVEDSNLEVRRVRTRVRT